MQLAHADALSKNGVDVINYAKVIPTFLFIFLAPLIGMVITYYNGHYKYMPKANPYKQIPDSGDQLVSSARSIGHGGNDAQSSVY